MPHSSTGGAWWCHALPVVIVSVQMQHVACANPNSILSSPSARPPAWGCQPPCGISHVCESLLVLRTTAPKPTKPSPKPTQKTKAFTKSRQESLMKDVKHPSMLPRCPGVRPCQIPQTQAGRMPALTERAKARPSWRQPCAYIMREAFDLRWALFCRFPDAPGLLGRVAHGDPACAVNFGHEDCASASCNASGLRVSSLVSFTHVILMLPEFEPKRDHASRLLELLAARTGCQG